MRNYEYRKIDEMTDGRYTMTGKPCIHFNYENNLLKRTDKQLLNNFFKCAKWIEEHCPKLNGEYRCYHQVYHWTKLVVENGKAYLEYGSHGYGFSLALSTTETATMSTGSMQSRPHAFDGVFFFRNDALEEFLSQWSTIKMRIEAENEVRNKIYSDNFEA